MKTQYFSWNISMPWFLPILVRNFFCFPKAKELHFQTSFLTFITLALIIFSFLKKKILKDSGPAHLSSIIRPMTKNLSKGYYRCKPTKAHYNYNFKGEKNQFILYIQIMHLNKKENILLPFSR